MSTNREAGVASVLPGPVGGQGRTPAAIGGGTRLPVFAPVTVAGEGV